MTIDNNTYVQWRWFTIILMSVVVGIITVSLLSASTVGKNEERSNRNTEQIKQLEQRVDKNLDRVHTKLDHIIERLK